MSQYSSNASKRSRPLEPSNAPTQGTAQAITLANQATPGSGVSSAPSSTTPTVPSEVSLAHPSTTWTANTEQSQPIANGLTPTPAEGGQTPTAAAVQANGEDTHGKRRKIIITKVIKNSNSQAGAGGSQDSSRGSVEKDIVDSIMNGAVGGMNIGGRNLSVPSPTYTIKRYSWSRTHPTASERTCLLSRVIPESLSVLRCRPSLRPYPPRSQWLW